MYKNNPMSIELSEQEQLRRQSLAQLRELGIDPYPAARYDVTATAREIADGFSPEKKVVREPSDRMDADTMP